MNKWPNKWMAQKNTVQQPINRIRFTNRNCHKVILFNCSNVVFLSSIWSLLRIANFLEISLMHHCLPIRTAPCTLLCAVFFFVIQNIFSMECVAKFGKRLSNAYLIIRSITEWISTFSYVDYHTYSSHFYFTIYATKSTNTENYPQTLFNRLTLSHSNRYFIKWGMRWKSSFFSRSFSSRMKCIVRCSKFFFCCHWWRCSYLFENGNAF